VLAASSVLFIMLCAVQQRKNDQKYLIDHRTRFAGIKSQTSTLSSSISSGYIHQLVQQSGQTEILPGNVNEHFTYHLV